MSSIEENAFQIARYVLENQEKEKLIEIRDALLLSNHNFLPALRLLIDDGCLNTYGQYGGKDAGIRQKNLAKLQHFVDYINEKRVPLSLDAEWLLRFLFNSGTLASDSKRAMATLDWSNERFLQAFDHLKTKGFVGAQYADDKPFDIWITPAGREIVRNDFHLPGQQASVINIEKIGNNSIVNIGSTLNSVIQTIQTNSTLSLSDREYIISLLNQLTEELKQAPPEKADDAEAVEKMAKDLVESAARGKPNQKIIEISADGLVKAAKNLVTVLPMVLTISEKIISFIHALGH